MPKWPIGVFASVDAGLGVKLEVARDLGVPTIQLHAPHAKTRTRAAAEAFNAKVADYGIKLTCVFGGFEGESYADIPTVVKTVGLVPSEYSSVPKQARGAITKTGNAHLRRVLLESAWHYRHHPFVVVTLRLRQDGAPAAVVQQAWAAQHRLHRRYHRLASRGKPKQHVVTAVARELTGFLWAALTQ